MTQRTAARAALLLCHCCGFRRETLDLIRLFEVAEGLCCFPEDVWYVDESGPFGLIFWHDVLKSVLRFRDRRRSVDRNDVEAAALTGLHVVDLAGSVNSSRCIEAVRDLQRRLRPYASVSEVEQFSARARDVLGLAA